MKKIKKIIIVIPIIAILICSMCISVSALSVTDYGFSITSCKFGWGSTPAQCLSNSKYAVEPIHYSNEQLEFKNITGNASASSYYRPLVLTLKAGTTNTSYTVNVQYVSYYGQNGVSVAFNFDGSPFAYVDGSQPSNFQTYSRYDASGNYLFYGGQFSFTINKGTTKTLYLCSGYNESIANLHGFSVWFDIVPNSETSQILQDNQQNTQDIIDNQNSNTDKEIQADKENTQAIIDNQNQLAEQEKQEIDGASNDSVDSATEAMPDYNLLESIGVFVDSLGSTDTECIIDIPEIYLPKISIIPRTTLYEGGSFNFETVIEMIPQKILLLVRYVLTAALILFSFKEFYNLIFNSVDGMSKIGDDV